jgi:hypothetical protein
MNAFEKARSLFPDMPAEIFDLWLDDRIRGLGWPPLSAAWRCVLCERSIEQWASLKWARQCVPLNRFVFASSSGRVIDGVIAAYFYQIENAYRRELGDDLFDKMTRINDYWKQHRMLPSTPILLKRDRFYDLVDGCHRISYLIYLQKSDIATEYTHECWIGST